VHTPSLLSRQRRGHDCLLLREARPRREIPRPVRRRFPRSQRPAKVAGLKAVAGCAPATGTPVSTGSRTWPSSSILKWPSLQFAAAANTNASPTPPISLSASARIVPPLNCGNTCAAAAAAPAWQICTNRPADAGPRLPHSSGSGRGTSKRETAASEPTATPAREFLTHRLREHLLWPHIPSTTCWKQLRRTQA
jgi:hypothetical protein